MQTLRNFLAMPPFIRMITAETTPLYYENAVAERLGLSRDDMRYLRRELLKPRKEWGRLDRKIVLSEASLERIVKHLGKSSSSLPASLDDFTLCLRLEKKVAAGDLATLTVRRLQPNPRLLLATNSAGRQCQVRVKTNANFRPNMSLQARRLEDGTYQQEGRCPRFPGRW